MLSPTANKNKRVSYNSIRSNSSSRNNIAEQNSFESPRNGRRRPRRDSLAGQVLSPKAASKGGQQYSQDLAFHSPKPTPDKNKYLSPQVPFNNSVTSIDWSNASQSPTSENSRKNNKYGESLIFDDDLSLPLHQDFVDDDDDEEDKNGKIKKRSSLQESGYQPTGVCTIVDGILAQMDHSSSTTAPPASSTSNAESCSSSSCSTLKEREDDKVYCSNVEIWGREKELDSLRSRFLATTVEMSSRNHADHSSLVNVAPRHVWISGVSGIGKTLLVDAFLGNDNILRMQPLICRGAFEENWVNASKSFSGIISCFTDLFKQFLDGNDTEEWRERMQVCLRDKIDVALLVSLIPSLAVLLDAENDDTKYSFEKTDRFLFGRLTRALGRILVLICKYSVVIFSLDDVHWAGDDSLQLLKALLLTNDLKNFFFIGSHRSGVKVSHSLHKIKSEVSALFGADVKLGGIGIKSAKSLVRSHLRRLRSEPAIDSDMLDALVKIWYTHSSSRIPIFLEHLVHLLYEVNGFEVKDGRWILHSPKILPSSSLSLVIERIEGLPIEYDLVLKSAALLDTTVFDTEMLMVAITAIPKSRSLEIDFDKVDNILRILTEKMLISEHSAGHYAFAHNVVKMAASSTVPVSTKRKESSLHWRLATDLKRLKDDSLALESETKNGITSLLIANHLNQGISSIEDRRKVEMMVKLYLQLAEAAMKRSAFVTASNILETGVAALDKKSKWEESYGLTLKTHLALARCLYCTGDLDKAKSILNAIIVNGHSPRDTIDAFDLLISIYRSKMQYQQSKQFALKALNDIWDDDIMNSNVEEKFSKVRELVQKKSDADLLVLPNLERKKVAKKMPFLLQLAEASGLCRDYKLQDLAALRMVELTLKYGSYEINYTGLAFALFGICVARRHLHGEAYRYGRLAEMMSEEDDPLGRQAIVHHNYSIRHWRNQLRGSRKPLKEICRATMKENEIENLSFQVGAYLSAIFYTGTPCSSEDSIMEVYNRKRKQFDLPENWNVIAPYNALVKLRGETSKLIKRKYSESKAVQYDIFFQMVLSIFMNDMEKAEKLNTKISMKPGGCWDSYRVFMEGLLATYYAQSSSGKSKLLYEKNASKFIEILTSWTKSGMNNSAHMANILNVQLMMSSDKDITSKRLSILVDTAISSAYHDGFPHHAALASERAGIYFLDTEDEKLASKYLSRASILYAEWGAVAKVEQLGTGYGNYLNADAAQMRSLKKRNSIASGSLMFTDKKSDSGTQLAGKKPTGRSKSHDYHRSPTGSRSPMASRRSLSSDSQKQNLILKRKKNAFKSVVEKGQSSPKPDREKAQSSHTRGRAVKAQSYHTRGRAVKAQSYHTRGRAVQSKALKSAKGPRSKSLAQTRRPILVRIGSSASINSLISNVSEDKTISRRSKKKLASKHSRGKSKTKEEKGKFQRRNSAGETPNAETANAISSKHSRGKSKTKEEKGKFQKFQRRNSTGETRKPSRDREKKKRGKRGKSVENKKTLTPVTAKKKVYNGPTPSPKPGRNMFVTPTEGSYLLHYDTDDFDDNMIGDYSDASFTSDKNSDESDSESEKDKVPKKPIRKKTNHRRHK